MKKTLILSLGRTGSLPLYAENITKYFKTIEYDFYASRYRINKNEQSFCIHEVITYKNKISFAVNTIFILPFLILKLAPKIISTYDTLYLPYKHFWDLPFIFLFKIFKKQVIFTAHDGILHTGEHNWFNQAINNYRLKNANKLIFLTNYTQSHVYNILKLKNVFEIIPHPIITNDFVQFKSKSTTKNLLFLGRIDKYKGVELLMNSIINIEDKFDKLIIAGKSSYNINYIKHDKVQIIDKYLSEKEIGELLSWADILILPYTEATQSGVIALGVFAELPMICTNVGGFREQLNEEECYWCEPNEKSLRIKISESFNFPDKTDLIKQLLKTKKKDLSWKVISSEIEKTILNVTNDK